MVKNLIRKFPLARRAYRQTADVAKPDISIAHPKMIRIEASSYCQLKCPACPTAQGDIHKSIVGSKFLKFEDFKRIVDAADWIMEIELSNWGEIFLNPEIVKIFNYAYKKGIDLVAYNGVNFNTVKDEALEGLVKYKVKALTCSIDGASQETYVQYRRRGNFDQVIANIRRLNEFKKAYNSEYPRLTWQFVLFQHNKHELEAARAMAKELGMEFYTKVSWDDNLAAKNEDGEVIQEVSP
ncbi:MAG: radical SAM protein [Bdellovibrionaceae bacterium]|nr:radical SAM protein [Bdellovibrionales bacterium]MCB9086434.1 radical SAM protein [Pseudobdellovibrionaceae bacterium]